MVLALNDAFCIEKTEFFWQWLDAQTWLQAYGIAQPNAASNRNQIRLANNNYSHNGSDFCETWDIEM